MGGRGPLLCRRHRLRTTSICAADWFVANASRGKLYYDVLELPGTDRALERLLQVDVARDLKEETAVRAGFNGSGVSRNNRVLQRHDSAFGAFWRSYDFSDNSDRQNIFVHPIGPGRGTHLVPPAGGEIIFSLPNGLHGYLLVDGDGRRVERAPVNIVSDPQRARPPGRGGRLLHVLPRPRPAAQGGPGPRPRRKERDRLQPRRRRGGPGRCTLPRSRRGR